MSMSWAPQNPRGFPVYGCQGKGPPQGTVREPVAADVETLADDPQDDTAKQLKTQKKRRGDKVEEKKAEEPVTKAPRKRPSNSSVLDYVVVSDTLSGLGVGDKSAERDPDDDATLTEIVKKKTALEDKKKELDAQAADALAEKKSKLQKDTATAPSESEVELVFLVPKLVTCWKKCTSLLVLEVRFLPFVYVLYFTYFLAFDCYT
ncbi:hypothetical protein HanLR1_Chr17g0681721 [Helianthus annuus]|nr:hypothetical protein HanLR1_Chr17g0681721 [Helianthus annuus]